MVNVTINKSEDGMFRAALSFDGSHDSIVRPIVSTGSRITKLSYSDLATLLNVDTHKVRQCARRRSKIQIDKVEHLPCMLRNVYVHGTLLDEFYFYAVEDVEGDIESVIGMDLIGSGCMSFMGNVMILGSLNISAYKSDLFGMIGESPCYDIVNEIDRDKNQYLSTLLEDAEGGDRRTVYL